MLYNQQKSTKMYLIVMQKLLYWYWLMILMGTVKTKKPSECSFRSSVVLCIFCLMCKGSVIFSSFFSHTKPEYNWLVEEEQQCELYELTEQGGVFSLKGVVSVGLLLSLFPQTKVEWFIVCLDYGLLIYLFVIFFLPLFYSTVFLSLDLTIP